MHQVLVVPCHRYLPVLAWGQHTCAGQEHRRPVQQTPKTHPKQPPLTDVQLLVVSTSHLRVQDAYKCASHLTSIHIRFTSIQVFVAHSIGFGMRPENCAGQEHDAQSNRPQKTHPKQPPRSPLRPSAWWGPLAT